MVPERCLTLASERLLVRRPEGILINPVERSEMGPDLFRAACNMGRTVWIYVNTSAEVGNTNI
jgi:bifunctional non-homologous end joining protein LigD